MKKTTPSQARFHFDGSTYMAERALPEEAPLSMPRHRVDEQPVPLRPASGCLAGRFATIIARLFVFAVTVGLSTYGVYEMYGVLSTNSTTYLQWLFLALFSVNFIWMAFAFAQALLGFLLHLKPRIISQPEVEPSFTTAVLLPIYNEEPLRIKAAVQAMRADLLKTAPGSFAIFLLSDTSKAEMWIAEEHAFYDLVDNDDSGCPVYYRRRSRNSERKAGNIAEWVERWGGAYEAMIILDADSIMSATSLQTLSRRLAAAPDIGLIQSLPNIVRATTVYARLQQFANQCFGPIYAAGLAAWHGRSSNFWGHNAIIRTRAFAEACCLPILQGKPPFGGHVLSHDFIEAALMRRAGWGIRFDTDIHSSFEEAPPSLIDVLIRDRRWCQGNLQHTSFLTARGLALPTRLHLLSGIMSYLSAVFWLSLIIVGLAIAVQATVVRPEYFAEPSLFPTWPVFDAERALQLFVVSMAIVLAPKIFGWLAALVNVPRCLRFGGPILLSLSTVVEIVVSALYAPILMVSQFGVVVSVLRGDDGGWMPQSRGEGILPWRSALRAHLGHTIFGGILALIAGLLSIELFYWLLPITAGLVLSIPLSMLSGSSRIARLFAKVGLLRVPNEKNPESVLMAVSHHQSLLPKTPDMPVLNYLARNPALCAWHIAQLPVTEQLTPRFHAPTVTAEWKLRHAENHCQLQEWLEPAEAMALLSREESIKSILALGREGCNWEDCPNRSGKGEFSGNDKLRNHKEDQPDQTCRRYAN